MSAIRSALDEMGAVDDWELSFGQMAADILELSHVTQISEVLLAKRLRNFVHAGGHHDLGYSSPTAFLVDQAGMSPSSARRLLAHGGAMDKAPHAHAAWADGRLSTDQARHLFRAAEAVPDAYPDAEERLVSSRVWTPSIPVRRSSIGVRPWKVPASWMQQDSRCVVDCRRRGSRGC